MAAIIQLIVYCDGKNGECLELQIFKTTDSVGEIADSLEKAGWESRPAINPENPVPKHFCPECRNRN